MGLIAVDEVTMHAAIAEALEMSIADFEAAIAEGKTPFILAQELGIDFAELQAAMDVVHVVSSQQAVTDGLLTQEQVILMLSHRSGQNGQVMIGRGQNNNDSNNGDCIYQTP